MEEIFSAKDYDMSAGFSDTYRTQIVDVWINRITSTAVKARIKNKS